MSTPCARQAATVSMRRINQCGGLARSPNSQRAPNHQGQVLYSRNATNTTARKIPKVLLAGGGVMTATLALGLSQTKVAKATVVEDRVQGVVQHVVQHVDGLYDNNKWKEALTYLEQHRDTNNHELLWRLARLCYKVGKYHSSGPEESRQLSVRGMEYAERAVRAGPDNFACHKWMGVLISYSSEFDGYKKKIERSFDIRDSFKRAIQLNPNDPTCRHLLGQWCYEVSSVPWYQKKLATMIFATPPNSDFEESLQHFQQAEQSDPGFYPMNWLYIGKSLLQLGRVEEAGDWLRKAANCQSQLGDDIEAKEEATGLLKRLGLSLS